MALLTIRRMVLRAFIVLLSACAPSSSSEEAIVKECVLPADQKGTLSGQWKVLPIPIAFHSGSNFSAEEMAAVIASADTWNNFFAESLGIQVFDYGSATAPNTNSAAMSTGICNTGIIANNRFTGQVILYKRGTWSYTDSSNVIALTTFCPYPATPVATIYNAALELNYEDYFVSGKPLPDIQTIVTHELGHLLGVDHSCFDGGKTGFPDCKASTVSAKYLSAVMYPKFAFTSSGIGELRSSLNSNDQGRANCLYKE